MQSPPFQLVAGHVAVDFVNTMDNRYDAVNAKDLIPTYEEFLRFCRQSKIISADQAHLLTLLPGSRTSATASAHVIREALERIFVAVVQQAPPLPDDLEIVNEVVREAMQHRILVGSEGSLRWQWPEVSTDARGPLWLIANAAAELLVSSDLGRVRECCNPKCRWLFLDTSKNRSRRWCDMKVCGNRAKARNYYRRAKQDGTAH